MVEQYVQRHKPLGNKTPELIKLMFGGCTSHKKETIGALNKILREATKGHYHFEGKDYKCNMSEHVRLCAQGAVLNYKTLGRYHHGDLMNNVWDAIQELDAPGLSKEYNAKRSKKKKQDNHHSDRIFVEAYKPIKNELYAFTKVGQSTFKNDEYIVARLAAGQRPSFEKPVAHAVETIESTESRKRRMYKDQFLNLQEQMLQHRWRVAFHTLYHELKKYQSRYVRVDEELEKMETLMRRAQEKFDGPSVLVRTLSMGRKAVKRCLSPKCKKAKRCKMEYM